MKKVLVGCCTLLVVASLAACAGNRREQLQQEFQFSNVDIDGNGVISRAEFESWKSALQSMRRG